MSEVSFTVDPDSLDTLGSRLSGIESRMQSAGDAVNGYSWTDLGPTPDVHSALQKFSSDWAKGLKTISSTIDQLTKRLGAAASDYRGTDNQIAQAATSGNGAP
ncbi:MAG TPA: type VII secretion target [Streptosporangiaceae bacterium]|jgi:uncharacterized protein YukE|nr:type VII secretion target [Streptosporangiaceae bacterium]